MYIIQISKACKKDIKLQGKRGKNFDKFKAVISLLEMGVSLDDKYRDHKLSGNWDSWRECHIEPDWLLIYRITDKTLELSRTGTHADLF